MYNANPSKIMNRAKGLNENAPLLNDENSSIAVGIPRLYRNAKTREVLGELPCPASMDVDQKVHVLSDITSNIQPQQRKRPLRNSKLGNAGTQDENFGHNQQKYKLTSYDRIPSKSAFTIHVDSENSSSPPSPPVVGATCKDDQPVEDRLDLHDAITALPKQAFGRVRESFVIEDAESPMVLDTSIATLDRSEEERALDEFDIYKADLFAYHRQAEERYLAKAHYMRKQTDITHGMRSILVDWLVEVAEEYKLFRQTLFLSVNYIDRFLSTMAVNRGKLQLLGTACTFIASKFEEIEAPDLGEFVYITDDTYSRSQVLKMEQMILKVLSFNVAVPTIHTFLEHYLHEANFDHPNHAYLSMYLIELTLLDADPYLQFLPSIIAAAAFFLAAKTLELADPWPSAVESYSGYSVMHFLSCVQLLYGTHKNAKTHAQQAIYQKYQQTKYNTSSSIPPLADLRSLRY